MGGRGSGSKPVDFTPAEGVDPWDAQPGESDKAFAAFVAYRDMGPDRAIRKVVKELGQKERYVSVLNKWSSAWGWVTRARAWDAHVDRAERQAVLAEAEKKAVERLRGAQLMVDVSIKSLYLWDRALNHAISQQQDAEKAAAAAGQPPPRPPGSPISPSDTQRLADTGVKLVQLLEGKPTDIKEQREQITIEERRKGIQGLIGNADVRAAMKAVALAMKAASAKDEPDPGGSGSPDPGGNGHATVH